MRLSKRVAGGAASTAFSRLAAASCNGQPRAIRDRLAPEEYQRLLAAARADACKKALAAEYGISLRSIYRLMATA